jgi:hypothetical protein
MVGEEESISPPFLYGRRRRIYIASIPLPYRNGGDIDSSSPTI